RGEEGYSGVDRLGRGSSGWIYSAVGLRGISSLQGASDRLRHAPDPSHRIHAGAGHCARSRWSRADYCRSRILKISPALRRSWRESDTIEKRFRALPIDPPPVDFEGATEQRCNTNRGVDEAGRAAL